MSELPGYKDFYDARRGGHYGLKRAGPEDSDKAPVVRAFIAAYGLKGKRCLEIGSSTGMFQDLVDDYTGTDVAEVLAPYYRKPYRVASGARYPFADAEFDAIWTLDVFEHIPDVDAALLEIRRLLRPGGVVLFWPAWQCRPWAADGYAVRPWSDFDWRGKLIKASIPVRDSVLYRGAFLLPRRLLRAAAFALGRRPATLRREALRPNYEKYWTADADACHSIDPHDAILWFRAHGFECLSHPGFARALLMRTGPLVFRKSAEAGAASRN